MHNGYIYILMNSSMNDLLKIGMSTREPEQRVIELSSSTGVPTPFILVYSEFFDDCYLAEKTIHEVLDSSRVSANREFFSLPIHHAIKAVQQVKASINSSNYLAENSSNYLADETVESKDSINTLVDEIIDRAEEYYYGLNETLEDSFEAYKLFKKASNMGSATANYYLGKMHWSGEGCKQDKVIAFDYYKKGAAQGNINCYARMGFLYMSDSEMNNLENGRKCWNQYFKGLSGDTTSKNNKIVNFTQYLYLCTANNVAIDHIEVLKRYKDNLVEQFQEDINRMVDNNSIDQWFKDYKVNLSEKCIKILKTI